MTDVNQPAIVVLGLPVSPELVQLVMPRIAQQSEPFSSDTYAAVVFP